MPEFKTHVTDVLDAAGITYRILPHSEPVYTIETAARQRGVIAEEMVKSILLRDRDGRFVMACVPGSQRVSPKLVQAALGDGWRRLRFATADEIREVTGSVQGAVSPLALPAGVPVVFDTALARLEKCNISGGIPTFGLELAAADLARAAGARFAPILDQAAQEV